MKYLVLGKDFKYKKDAWKYFKSQLYSIKQPVDDNHICLLYTSDAADE